MIPIFLRTPNPIRTTTLRNLLAQLDVPGTVVIIASLICFFLATESAGAKRSWSSPVVIGELIGAVLLAIAFAVIEYFSQERAALVPRIFSNRPILVSAAYVFL